jgi:hypothetical protein
VALEPVFTLRFSFLPVLGALAVGARYYVERQEKQLSAQLITTRVEAVRKRQEPMWTTFIKTDASQSIPPIAHFAKIQFKLWSDDNTIPLMIRIASKPDGGMMSEVAGPSGVVELMLVEKQTLATGSGQANILLFKD